MLDKDKIGGIWDIFDGVGSELPSGSKTKIYVATGNPFDEYANTSFDAEKAVYIEGAPNINS